MADISNIANVQILINAGGINPRDFGATLFLTPDATLPASDSLRIYDNLDNIDADFAEGSEPQVAGEIYFAQVLTPKPIFVGRWFKTDVAAKLVGGAGVPVLATLLSINDGSFNISATDITALDFTTDISYTEIAATITAGLAGAAVDATCTFDSVRSAFVITTNTAGAAETLTYASTAAGGTDLSTLLLLSSTTASSLSQGQDAETIVAAFDRLRQINGSFYFVTVDVSERDQPTLLELSAHIQSLGTSAPYMMFAESASLGVLTTNETASVFAQLFAAQSSRTAGDWETSTATGSLLTKYMSVSSASYLSGAFDFEAIDGVGNPNLSDRPLIQQSTFTPSQVSELNRKRINRFSPVGGGTVSNTILNVYQFGQVFKNGLWQDIVYGVDWLQNLIQVNLFNYMKAKADLGEKVPQTVDGQAQLAQVIKSSLDSAVTNSLLAPGTLSAVVTSNVRDVTGNRKFNGVLPLGYLVFGAPFSTLTEQQRIDKKMPIFYFWAKASGAANSTDVQGIIDQ